MAPSLPSRKYVFLLLIIFVFLLFGVYFLTQRSPNSIVTRRLQRTYGTGQSRKRIMKPNVWSQQKPLVDCKQLIKGDRDETSRATSIIKRYPKKPISPKDFIKQTGNCERFKNKRRYIQEALSKTEQNFPIAYGIAIYKDVEQFERLLRALYRPQNYYCVHIDLKSPKDFHQAVASIANCFPNVILASRFVDVIWGAFSVLEAYLICLKDLLDRFKDWKYFINLAGQEFPMKTNNELVAHLRSLNARSLVKRRPMSETFLQKRLSYVYNKALQHRTKEKKKPFRYKLNFYKGSVYVALSHQFANYSLTDKMAKELLEWLKDSGHPDETFFNTLIANIPANNPLFSAELKKPTHVSIRYVLWVKPGEGAICHGKVVRQVCIFGIGDLKRLSQSTRHLFLNKFHLDFQYPTLDCWEQWMYNKTYAFYRDKQSMLPRNAHSVNGTGA